MRVMREVVIAWIVSEEELVDACDVVIVVLSVLVEVKLGGLMEVVLVEEVRVVG